MFKKYHKFVVTSFKIKKFMFGRNVTQYKTFSVVNNLTQVENKTVQNLEVILNLI
jgi:hypothetical protein